MENVQKDIERENRLLSHHSPQPAVLFLEATIIANFREKSPYTNMCVFFSYFLFIQIIVFCSKKARCKKVYLSISLSIIYHHVCLLCELDMNVPDIFRHHHKDNIRLFLKLVTFTHFSLDTGKHRVYQQPISNNQSKMLNPQFSFIAHRPPAFYSPTLPLFYQVVDILLQ